MAQRLDEQAQKLEEWRGELSAVKKEAECYVREQCELLAETVNERLSVVEAESEARVVEAVDQVAGLRREVAELRVTVAQQTSHGSGSQRSLGRCGGLAAAVCDPFGCRRRRLHATRHPRADATGFAS